jgi:hypothetical protein
MCLTCALKELKSAAAEHRKEMEEKAASCGGIKAPHNFSHKAMAMFWTYCHNGNRTKAMKWKAKTEAWLQQCLDELMFPEGDVPYCRVMIDGEFMRVDQEDTMLQVASGMKSFTDVADHWLKYADRLRHWN